MTQRPDVVSLVLAGLHSADLREIVEHWDTVRGDRLMPAWSDIDAVAIARHLPNMWAWKYDRASNSFTGRLAGETINAIFGKSLRHAKMEEFFAGWNYDTIFERHRRVVCDPCLVIGKGLVFIHAGRYGTGERVILPLADNGIDADGIVGATIYELSTEDSCVLQSEMVENVSYYPLIPAGGAERVVAPSAKVV